MTFLNPMLDILIILKKELKNITQVKVLKVLVEENGGLSIKKNLPADQMQ